MHNVKGLICGILLCGFSLTSFTQDTVSVGYYFRHHFIFNSGFWVYQDSATNVRDSITLESVMHGYYGPNPVMSDYHEYYLIEYYSHTNDSLYNDFFWENLWRVNGGGTWAELGQPVMWLGSQGNPVLGGYNGFEILELLDSLVVGEVTYYNGIWSHVYEAQQYQHEFEYDTDLFYAENIGLVREEYTDNNNVFHVWNLVNWECNLITGIDDKNVMAEMPLIFPNPARNKINIAVSGLENVKIYNAQGKLMIEESNNEIDLSKLPPGIYFLSIQHKSGIFKSKIVKL